STMTKRPLSRDGLGRRIAATSSAQGGVAMSRSEKDAAHFLRRRRMLQGAAAALMSVGTRARAQGGAKPLQVGGLPVTCNLTLPVVCMASATDAGGGTPLFEF